MNRLNDGHEFNIEILTQHQPDAGARGMIFYAERLPVRPRRLCWCYTVN